MKQQPLGPDWSANRHLIHSPIDTIITRLLGKSIFLNHR